MKQPAKDVQFWLDEIDDARKREKEFRNKGKEIMEIYGGERCKDTPFNILYSNTETLLPALYSNDPRPVVRPKFKNKANNKIAQAASQAAERMLEYLIDNDVDGYEKFSEALVDATMDALLPGRGDVSVHYDADVERIEEDGEELADIKWETAYLSSSKWNRVYYGYALKWSDIPWKAYEMFIDKDEATRLFGKRKANKLKYTEGQETDENDDEINRDNDENTGSRETCHIYQIWDKTDKTVKYISTSYTDGIIHSEEDPLELSGFINSPRPLQFIHKPNDMIPVSLYVLYENQAKELNRVTYRLKFIIEAIKVRGVYNGKLGTAIEEMLSEDDNGLVAAEDEASLLDGSMDKAIWLMPVEKLIIVAQQLIQAREAIKKVIFEITGISDILRGSSAASETLGAQKIKESWGTMRLKKMQKDTQVFARNCLRMLIDVATKKFSDESWVKMTGLPFLTDEQFQQAQMDLQQEQFKAQQMMQQQQMQSQGQPQQPPPPSQIAQKAMMALEQPRWSEVLAVLRDDFNRSFLIDIETNSTLDVEATEDKKNISEFMNALAQFMNGAAPMVQSGILPFEAMKSMLLAITQRFRFGSEVEEEIKKMKAPKPQVDEKAQKEIQATKQKLEQDRKTFEENLKKAGDKLDQEFMNLEKSQQQFEHEKQLFKLEQDFQKKMLEMELNMDKKEAESQVKEIVLNHKRDIQSMMDKQQVKFQQMIMKTQELMRKEDEREDEKESEMED